MRARILRYPGFFREIAKTLPNNFKTTLCMNLNDLFYLPDAFFHAPVFAFQKKRSARNLLLPDIDFLAHDFYTDPIFLDDLPYGESFPPPSFPVLPQVERSRCPSPATCHCRACAPLASFR